ncbi:hypothetical protein AXG93_291s1260 [Marchantia polymorpha subsp. ruderalis]|uniref:DUF547 domain-containing protein n=1 Tax=Marchantia polymorpha subsp. ruderalis TaxID=1480154 RepID=A0A176VIT8_MARPO|nr:hypothetical protein AXG93_291s1260 [Marchantia polymorpha subsp. ruderalis]
MTLMKMASFSNKMQNDLLPEDSSIIFPMPTLLVSDVSTTVNRGHCRSLRQSQSSHRPCSQKLPRMDGCILVETNRGLTGLDAVVVECTPRSSAWLSLGIPPDVAPAEATATTAPWDLSPGAFQHLKENWQGWKWKMMKKNNGDKKKRALYDRRVALEEDVAHLQTQLKTERAVRQGLERALGQGQSNKRVPISLPGDIPASTFSPKAKELITEIANLETEVASLEHHVLSLYRKVLDQQMCTSPPLSSVSSVHNVPNLSGLSTPTDISAPAQQRLFSKISLKRKSAALTSSHRRNVSSATTSGTNETQIEVASAFQTKSRHGSLLGGAFNCIDGSSAQETSQQLSSSSTILVVCFMFYLVTFSFEKLQDPNTSSVEQGKSEIVAATSRENSKKEAFLASPQTTALALLSSGPHSAPASESGFGKYSESPRLYPGTPNRLSEELVRCMAAIYCKLADPPLSASSAPISPSSCSSSSSGSSMTTTSSSPRGFSTDSWAGSPGWRGADNTSEVAALVDPFQLKDRKGDVVGAYSSAVEVPWICVDKDRLTYAARALRNFRSMVEQLEKVDPGLMKHEEKMAFWINVYNALMMHCVSKYSCGGTEFIATAETVGWVDLWCSPLYVLYVSSLVSRIAAAVENLVGSSPDLRGFGLQAYLAYGIPRSHLKRLSLVQKASYKVGPHSINAHMIEHCILGCRSRRPTQWLQTFFSTASKFKSGDERKSYALDKVEPLVCFALCCGGRSDPAIRVYSAKHVRQELECARRDYLQASIGIRSGSRVLLPRILEWYARECSIAHSNLLEWVCQFVSDKQQAAIKKFLSSKSQKNAANCVEWLPYNSTFRYIFVRDLARLAPLTTQ